jgi:hypothetical protein
MTMRHEFTEIVLSYQPQERDAWNTADATRKRAMIPPFHELHRMILNQPRYHFGEFHTLRHFHQTEGWLGFRFFVLGLLSDFDNPRYAPGGEQIRRTFSRERLEAYIKARGGGRADAGDPDLFLYKPNGEAMFLEVKVDGDRVKDHQLQTLAQIRHYVGCRAEIVHVGKHEKPYSPKIHWVDMALTGIMPVRSGTVPDANSNRYVRTR